MPAAAPLLCAQSELLLAIGIVSAPDYHPRRMAQRHSWMRWPSVGHHEGASTCATFIVRAGNAPPDVARALQRETDAHGDTLLVRSIAYNENRVRGPMLTLAHWLLHAAAFMRHAKFIGKLDDDAYLHVPDLERMLHTSIMSLGARANVYIGVHTWYHWYAKLFDNTRHAWTYHQAMNAGRVCRAEPLRLPNGCGAGGAPTASNGSLSSSSLSSSGVNADIGVASSSCGTCVGPFAFAAGYLIVLSRTLVDGLVTAGGVEKEARLLAAMSPKSMRDKHGKPQEQVMEDIWLGSILYRYPLPTPVHYISLLGDRGSALYVDAWDFRMARTAVLIHIITKQLDRYLAIHDLVQSPTHHCSRPFKIRCASNCATRADSGGYSEREKDGKFGVERLPKRREWCRHGAASGSVADQWCTVISVARGGARMADGGTRTPCCGASTNRSCTKLFGSNQWPHAYKRHLPALHRRFRPVGRGNLTIDGRGRGALSGELDRLVSEPSRGTEKG